MLKATSQAIMALLEDELPGKRLISIGGSLESYLRKVFSISTDTKNMAHAAVSPQCKNIFDKIPNIVGLPGAILLILVRGPPQAPRLRAMGKGPRDSYETFS
jgi:hypothetical protein